MWGSAIATVQAIMDHEVERFWLDPDTKRSAPEYRRNVLESVFDSLRLSIPEHLREDPEGIRELAGTYPHGRVRVTCWVRGNMKSDGELENLGPIDYGDDVERDQSLLDRTRRLMAAQVLEEIQNIEE